MVLVTQTLVLLLAPHLYLKIQFVLINFGKSMELVLLYVIGLNRVHMISLLLYKIYNCLLLVTDLLLVLLFLYYHLCVGKQCMLVIIFYLIFTGKYYYIG